MCTGHVCRSPAVERLLAARLPDSEVRVTSAGTFAIPGTPMTPQMVELVTAAGANADGFASQRLTRELVAEAHLVLALTREHRSAVVSMHPSAVTITFTLREFGRLAAEVDRALLPSESAAGRLTALLDVARNARGLHQVPPVDDDVIDPYGHDARIYQQSFDELYGPVQSLLALL